jgi:dihydrolipoamide dehydrogenase
MVVGSLSIETETVIIGSGPGGYVAAIRAAQLGQEVILVEKRKKVGGVCLHVGCIPTKALITSSDYVNAIKELNDMGISIKEFDVDITKMNSWKDTIIEKMEKGIRSLFSKYGIEIIEGEAKFKSKNSISISGQSDVNEIKFKNAIVATGSSPIEIPGFPFDKKYILSSNQAMSLSQIPKSLLIVGGGYIGTELGTVYGKLGSEVHILEGSDRLISVIDKDVVDVVAKRLEHFNVTIHYNAKALSSKIENEKVQVEYETQGKKETIEVEKVLVVVGRKPNGHNLGLTHIGVEIDEKGFIKVNNQMRTTHKHIYAIGDVVGNPMLAHKAMREAKIAAEAIAGKPVAFDNQVIPSVVYNDPEIVSVGLTVDQAKEQGREVIEEKFPYAALARAHMFNRTDGFIKMIADKNSHRILGVHAVGPHVSEIVAEATLAIEMGAKVEDLAFTIHPHPTISEGMGEVAETLLGSAIHIYKPKKED